MELAAYKKQLVTKCAADRDCIALGLAFDVTQGVADAYAVIKQYEATPSYDRGLFIRVAKQILNEYNNDKQQNPAGEHTRTEHPPAAHR
jgi:hypothetical protein